MAKDAKRVYPHAVSLMETVRMYGQTLDLVENNKDIEWLVAEYRNESQRMVSRGKYQSILYEIALISGQV
jgi:dynein heavy chain 1